MVNSPLTPEGEYHSPINHSLLTILLFFLRFTIHEIRFTRYSDGRNCPEAFLDNKYIVDMVNLPMKEKKKEKDR